MLEIKQTSLFKKDFKRMVKRGVKLELLGEVVNTLKVGNLLAEKYDDHALTGNWAGYRECHVQPDWLLIYRIDGNDLVLVLTRTGSHSDLF